MKAVELGREAAQRRARGEQQADSTGGEGSDSMKSKASLVQDMVSLSQASTGAKANSAVARVADENAAAVLGLGNKLDVKA